MLNKKNRVRVGIDVGGTFTKAVALDLKTGDILGKSTVLTTHTSEKGVSNGIIKVLDNVMKSSNITFDAIELISHSTTQAINALLESDTFKVGIVAMGVGPTKKDVIKRTDLSDPKINSKKSLKTAHKFLDTSELISEQQVSQVIQELKDGGAKVIVATEAFGVDDPSNEKFVMNMASKLDLPSTASHEISGIYGLEIRTLTAAVNASVLPKTVQVANYVENAIRDFGVKAPLMIMKGDGGVTSMKTFRTKPILTVLSGPAASVAGGLLHQRVTNGIFVEVGGTSTNICIIKNGKPEIRYVTINEHPTCIRSMDVRIKGVAGGSMNTADLAHQYGRELFAVPGRPTDKKSGGCHQLIVQQKAQLLSDPHQLIEALGWEKTPLKAGVQKVLFQSLNEQEQKVFSVLSKKEKAALDEIALELGGPISVAASELMQMEMKGMVRALPGKHFEWI